MDKYRSFIVYGVSAAALMTIFLIFMFAGWPGSPDDCTHIINGVQQMIDGKMDSCYCEHFTVADVLSHKWGIRQPVNTWFNLYALFTGLTVAWGIYIDRRDGVTGTNLMRTDSWVADMYVFAVLFLGLGSMWFHASLTSAVSWFDGFSMYVYAGFLVWYTVYRLTREIYVFLFGYIGTVIGFTFLGIVIKGDYTSLILIVTLVVAYLTLEIWICVRDGTFMLGTPLSITFWILAVVCIILATTFWILSQTGRPLCHADSFFQPHGILWHPLAGLMATFLYFYWRQEPTDAP
jgi:hypothetical protein